MVMTLRSKTVTIKHAGSGHVSSAKGELWTRHKDAIDRVLADAKSFSQESQRTIKKLQTGKSVIERKS